MPTVSNLHIKSVLKRDNAIQHLLEQSDVADYLENSGKRYVNDAKFENNDKK